MKCVKERLYEYFCRIFRREIIRDGFQGVLGRDPEEKALRAYEGSFPGLGVSGVIRDLTESGQAWEKQKLAHAKELIREAYQGVLGRDPEVESQKAYEKSFTELGTDCLIKELSGSQEAWEKQKGAHAEELIREAYLGVLGREPEEEALETYAGSFRGLGIEGVIWDLCASEELWEKQKGVHTEELIREAYRGVLKREADEAGLEYYKKRFTEIGLGGLIRTLSTSDEKAGRIRDQILELLLKEKCQ
jgi:hypothetical protein